MALIKCEECGNMISDKASVCPHCGCPTNGNDVSLQDNDTTDIVVSYKDKENNSHKWLYIIIGLLTIISVGMVVWAWNSGGFSSSQENATSQGDDFILGNTHKTETFESNQVKQSDLSEGDDDKQLKEENRITNKGNWNYSTETDPMTDNVTHIAHCVSTNKAIVCGMRTELHLGLVHNHIGNYVILSVLDGILRQERLPMAHVRFDDGEVNMWSVMPDGATTHHIVAAEDFISQIKKSSKCAIKVECQDGGTATYTFKTAGLKWNY